MSSVRHLQYRREELQEQYNLLREKIRRLRVDSAIQAGTLVAYQLEKEIERFEVERDRLQQEITSIERSLESERIHSELFRLNYVEQVRLFREFIEQKRVGAFLVHGLPEHGQIFLLKRLLHAIPDSTVVLIDEIDKADIDFPNDLLLELDEKRFEVAEVKQSSPIKRIQAKATPIVIITSNDEKDLPDAFLRRCLFHYVKFPERQQLIEIVKAHFPTSPLELVDAIIERFLALREEMRRDKGEAGKKVSTSELMDWVRILRHHDDDEILTKLKTELLYPGVLLKSWDDYRRYAEQTRSQSRA
ncbi:AAA family ATPase [Iningainema tapete]|uniref:Inactive STAND domain-containing protein n=1 Tax=Iningainema tapete BLCC-T55 TaxID=2748662 RepID=A0A8J6XTK2_9CYAN|nr:MoxR family ATPase [Iningainema tapete]MBD2773593.1 hypothetical protein [Iningainema tapete BLCC-T55]